RAPRARPGAPPRATCHSAASASPRLLDAWSAHSWTRRPRAHRWTARRFSRCCAAAIGFLRRALAWRQLLVEKAPLQQRSFGGVPGQLERACSRFTRLFAPSEPLENLGTCGLEKGVAVQT